MSNYRYNDYYLVNDEDVDEDSIEFRPTKKPITAMKVIYILLIIFTVVALVAFILIFVVFPLVFMKSVTLQQNLVFTHWNLESDRTYFEEFYFPGYKNHYVTVKDIDNHTEDLNLGLWHILPFKLTEISLNDSSYDFDAALRKSNFSVLLYFHGTGEDRSQSERKYQLLRYFFHVIAFDYRSYADSTKGQLFERNVVHDCVQIYKWLENRTESPIYVWGHSLGAALATSTLAQLHRNSHPQGLILEAPFTTFKEELYHHPIVKLFISTIYDMFCYTVTICKLSTSEEATVCKSVYISKKHISYGFPASIGQYFKWLPWFEPTVVKPLEKNGFIFNTAKHILNIDCSIMFLHAEDDEVVPYYMSQRLYNISKDRIVDEQVKNNTVLILFDKKYEFDHNFIYQDPYVMFDVVKFLNNNSKLVNNTFNGSHQS